MSGYGMETSNRRYSALVRTIPYILYFFLVFVDLFFCFFQVLLYPTSWFLVVYFAVMFLYRFVSNIYGLLWSFIGLAAVMILLDFNWVWMASFGGFFVWSFFCP